MGLYRSQKSLSTVKGGFCAFSDQRLVQTQMLTMPGVTLTVGCDVTVAGLLNREMHTGHCVYRGTVVPCRVTDTSDNTLGSASRQMHVTDCSVFTGHTKFSILREASLPRHTKGRHCSIRYPRSCSMKLEIRRTSSRYCAGGQAVSGYREPRASL